MAKNLEGVAIEVSVGLLQTDDVVGGSEFDDRCGAEVSSGPLRDDVEDAVPGWHQR